MVIVNPAPAKWFRQYADNAVRLFARGALNQSVEMLVPDRFQKRHPNTARVLLRSQRAADGRQFELHGGARTAANFGRDQLSPLEPRRHVGNARFATSLNASVSSGIQEKNIELEPCHQAKDRFLATMSHELRTPLERVIGFTGTLHAVARPAELGTRETLRP